jgi:hypothetical protein
VPIHQHRDAVGQTKHHAHVVLNDYERAPFGQTADQRDSPFRLGMAHARGRLVQHHDVGAARNGDADLKLTLLGIAKKSRGHVAAMTEMTFFQNA